MPLQRRRRIGDFMAASIIELLKKKKPLLWDGGMGTELIARGLTSDTLPELWNIERPDDVRAIHAAYYAAGAVAAQSNTFGGHPMKLEAGGLADRTEELNRAGAMLVVEARPKGKIAVGDIGPCGAMLAPVGDADPTVVKDGFRRQAQALAQGGVDVIHIETMFDLQEIVLAIEAALETGLEVMASMTFEKAARGFFTIMGISPQRAAGELAAVGAVVVGANCSIGPADMVELIREFRKFTAVPLIAQANAGKPRIEGGKVLYDVGAEEFASFAPLLADAGADIIGGCCGATPEFIGKMSAKLKK